jgi:hypothetical protein
MIPKLAQVEFAFGTIDAWRTGCYWHKADILETPINVRFRGSNGHPADRL